MVQCMQGGGGVEGETALRDRGVVEVQHFQRSLFGCPTNGSIASLDVFARGGIRENHQLWAMEVRFVVLRREERVVTPDVDVVLGLACRVLECLRALACCLGSFVGEVFRGGLYCRTCSLRCGTSLISEAPCCLCGVVGEGGGTFEWVEWHDLGSFSPLRALGYLL